MTPPLDLLAPEQKSTRKEAFSLKQRRSKRREKIPRVSDIVVFCHLRWDFVFQRPQHLMVRFADHHRVFFVEEPLFDATYSYTEIKYRENGVCVVVPHLKFGESDSCNTATMRNLLSEVFRAQKIQDYLLWYYTPMALPFTSHLQERAIVYDCMDELSLLKDAHPALLPLERSLFRCADIVFTGGHSLFEHKRNAHDNIHPFPSSIDASHFMRARSKSMEEPEDQKKIKGKKIGYFGVIDERMDLSLVDFLAKSLIDHQIVLLGPVTKIDPSLLPRRSNIHYLGSKKYHDLPAYLSRWDLAILPFAKNAATRFISPTKTPEYLAAGKQVVSTSIKDVVEPYGLGGFVAIADSPEDFVAAAKRKLNCSAAKRRAWLDRVDQFLLSSSWNRTWSEMSSLVAREVAPSILRESYPLSSTSR